MQETRLGGVAECINLLGHWGLMMQEMRVHHSIV